MLYKLSYDSLLTKIRHNNERHDSVKLHSSCIIYIVIIIAKPFTSDQHGDDAEDLLRECIGRHITEAHTRKRRTREIKCRHIALAV